MHRHSSLLFCFNILLDSLSHYEVKGIEYKFYILQVLINLLPCVLFPYHWDLHISTIKFIQIRYTH